MKTKNILIIGDIILDEYVQGTVTRISPEAPIPILNKQETYYRLGGAANVARNVNALGGKTWIIGRIGKDSAGNKVKHMLCDEGIMTDLLLTNPDIPTIVKTRFVAENHQLLRVDYEDTSPISDLEKISVFKEDLERHLRYFDGVIISDYNKGTITEEIANYIGFIAKKYNKIITVDTHKKDISCYSGYSCITPNLKELQMWFEKPLNSLDILKDAIKVLKREFNFNSILLTLSEKGILVIDEKENTTHIPVTVQDIVDVTGCGDTVIAVYTLGLCCGLSEYEAAKLSNRAAGIVASKFGTAVCTSEELDNA